LNLAPGTWHLEPGTWHSAPGTWHPAPGTLAPGTRHLAPGTRNLGPGNWYPEPGTRHLVPGTWYLPLADNTSANLPLTETYEYTGIGGAISKRITNLPLFVDATVTQSFNWDQLGNLTTLDYPTLEATAPKSSTVGPARNVSYTYAWGWLSGVTGYTTSMSYYKNGMPDTVVHANGVSVEHGLDPRSMQRPSSITVSGPNIDTWTTGTISYDGSGNITGMGDDWFLYDGLSRLKVAHLSDVNRNGLADAVDITYRYDAFGNRTDTYWDVTDEDDNLSMSWYTYDTSTTSNRLVNESYDVHGNMTTLQGNSFTWYPFNQIQRRTGTGLNQTYGYTVDSERLLTWDRASGTDRFSITVRGLDGKVIREFAYDGATETYSWVKDYIHANGKLLATIDDEHGTRHYHPDHLGSPRVITDASGSLITDDWGEPVGLNAYSPFGIQLIGENGERLKFTGHERDAGNIDYMHARYYSPMVGRFLSVDPVLGEVGSSQGWNRYSYVQNRPTVANDPTGKDDNLCIWEDMKEKYRQEYPDVDEAVFRDAERKASITGGTALLLLTPGPEELVVVSTVKLGGRLLGAGTRAYRAWRAMRRAKKIAKTSIDLATTAKRGKPSRAGRLLQKHRDRPGMSFLKDAGNAGNHEANTAAAKSILNRLLKKGKVTTGDHPVHGNVISIRQKDGAGFMIKETGEFVTFLERYSR
jgi:RHS repeat-associated protein